MRKLFMFIAMGLLLSLFSSNTHAQFNNCQSGPWGQFNYSDGYTVFQDGWGSQDYQSQQICANSAGNWRSSGSFSGGGVKCYPHTQKDVDLPIGGNGSWCSASFNCSASDNGTWYNFMFDCWTANMQDELIIPEYWNGNGTWGDLIAQNVNIGGRQYNEVRKANNGSNNVIVFGPQSRRSSGSEDLMAIFQWCKDRGVLVNNSALHQVSFGVEITYTNGWMDFTCNSFSVNFGQNGGGGGGGGCSPTSITPYIQVNNGSWQQTSDVTVSSGSTVKFGPQPDNSGSWSWSGCGVSGNSREQTFTANSSCTATATYTNSGGCQSTKNFNVSVSGGGGGNSGNVTIQNKATGLYIDGMGRGSNGDNAGQWSGSGSNNQQWTAETAGSNYRFKNVGTGLYLDGMGRTSNGSLVGQWSSSGINQQWVVETYGNYKRIKNAATGLYIDGMYWGSNGSDLGQWSGSGSDAQQWTINGLKSATEIEAGIKQEVGIKVQMSPNPFSSEINLIIDKPEKITWVKIFDFTGKLVETIDKSSITSSSRIGASLKSGMYIVKINGTDMTKSFKIVKN